jgi:hypothetical protein
MGHLTRLSGAQVPAEDVIDACGMGYGYSERDGVRRVCFLMTLHGEDGQHFGVSYSVDPGDIDKICDALKQLAAGVDIGGPEVLN